MATLDKLLSFLNKSNLCDDLEDEKKVEIINDAITGFEIDFSSRESWLKKNKEAMSFIKGCKYSDIDGTNMNTYDREKDFPFDQASQVIYPLLMMAVVQLSSRLITNLVRENRVCECSVLGPDPNNQKEDKAKRVSDFLSFDLLVESDTWLLDKHKLLTGLSAWGVAFQRIYYDPVDKVNVIENIPQEQVVINTNIQSLKKAPRITVIHYLSKNDLLEKIRNGEFCEIDLEELDRYGNQVTNQDSQEPNPIFELHEQATYIDLDNDGYVEPYIIVYSKDLRKLFQIRPNYKVKDIISNEKGQIIKINPRLFVNDFHAFDDPEGKYYSLGLNHLLLDMTRSITSVQRQLLDSGTASNTQGGFITKGFKTYEKHLKLSLNEWTPVDTAPGAKLQDQIMPLPFKEPSQVLFQLLGLLIESGKELGMITDVLTGDTPGQNVPATTILAIIEQGTRAFRPLIQKLYASLKKEFRLLFKLYGEHLEDSRYFKFNEQQQAIVKTDFDDNDLDVVPVADPTMSSEAHKYAMIQAMLQPLQMGVQGVNVQAIMVDYYKSLGLSNPEKYIQQQPQGAPPPDPKMVALQQKNQLDQQQFQHDAQVDMMKQKAEQEREKTKRMELGLKQNDQQLKVRQQMHQEKKDAAEIAIQQQQSRIAAHNAHLNKAKVIHDAAIDRLNVRKERAKLDVVDQHHRDKMDLAENERSQSPDTGSSA
jgi:chaperonin GroES